VKQFFRLVNEKPPKIAIFGPVLSVVTESVASVSKYWNLVEISPTSTSMKLTDRKEYPYFFRTAISDISYNPARVAFIKHFNWTRVGIIYEIKDVFLHAINDLQEIFAKNGIVIVSSESFTTHPRDKVARMKSRDVRIILLFAYPVNAIRVFCEAYHQKVYGSKYVWMLPGFFLNNWFINNLNDAKVNCTAENLQEVIEGYIAFKNEVTPRLSEPTLSGYTQEGFKTAFANFSSGKPLVGSYTYAYDAIWALALGLNRTDIILRKQLKNLTLFDYNDTVIPKILINEMNNVSFIGLTDRIVFIDGNRVGSVIVMQYQKNTFANYTIQTGNYNYFKDKLTLGVKGNTIKWQGSFAPVDVERIEIEEIFISSPVFTLFACLAGIGIALCAAFIFLNVSKQHDRLIKMSSPKINIVMLLGSILCYISVLFFGLDSKAVGIRSMPIFCHSAAWTICLGFTLGFGALFWKTWRVYSIYRNKTKRSIIIKDKSLIGKIFALTIFDAVIMILWHIIDPIYTKQVTLNPKLETNAAVITRSVAIICVSNYMTIWMVVIYCWKFLLIVFGAFLAWETRHVTIPELNDSKLIGLCIYNVFVLCVTGVLLTAVVTADPITSYCLIASFIVFCTSVTIIVIFVPKVSHSNKYLTKFPILFYSS
ncbi:uncharacterized protein TRIADDRAFT_28568, partial [Trichoplax adhaerens]